MGAPLGKKYAVAPVEDPDGKHDHCRYFVLDPEHDTVARVSLRVYAQVCSSEGNHALARDLHDWLDEIDRQDP